MVSPPPSDPPQSGPKSILEEAKNHHRQGNVVQAEALYDQFLAADPNNVDVLYFSGLACTTLRNFSKAVDRFSLASKTLTNHPVLMYSLGVALLGLQHWDAALERFTEVVHLNPDNLAAYCQIAQILLQQKKGLEAAQQLEKALQRNPAYVPAHEQMSTVLRSINRVSTGYCHQRLAWYHAKNTAAFLTQPLEHTFFLDWSKALSAAYRGDRVKDHELTTSPQLCFYLGEPIDEIPLYMIPVPSLDHPSFEAFFFSSKLPFPVAIDFDPDDEDETQLAFNVAKSLDDARSSQQVETRKLEEECRQIQPEYIHGKPLRVFLPISRLSTVGAGNCRDLAQGFKNIGCEVLYFIESNDRELLNPYQYRKAQRDFNPHIVFEIDILNETLHSDAFSVMWLQNVGPLLRVYMRDGRTFPCRERDLVYSLVKELEPLMYQCGATKVEQQGSCYDGTIFQNFGWERKRKVVFVGAARSNYLLQYPQAKALVSELEAMFEAGKPFTDQELIRLSKDHDMAGEIIFWRLVQYIVRDLSVRWLCTMSNEIDVDVYGYAWEQDEIVRPFYRGVLPHGPDLAAVYNKTVYALVPHQSDLESQRLVEVAACGAIPVAYDCRYRSGEPQGNDSFLWYRTKEELRACLTKQPSVTPYAICEGRTYTHFAQRVITTVESCLSGKRDLDKAAVLHEEILATDSKNG